MACVWIPPRASCAYSGGFLEVVGSRVCNAGIKGVSATQEGAQECYSGG